MSDKLKPCPFCGHKGILCGNGRSFEVICDNRDCPVNDSWSYGEEAAVNAWNTRTESTNENLIAELEKQIADLKAQMPYKKEIAFTCNDKVQTIDLSNINSRYVSVMVDSEGNITLNSIDDKDFFIEESEA